MAHELSTLEVSLRYSNRSREYRWETDDDGVAVSGWDTILARRAVHGWRLVSACIEAYQENNTNMEATSYRLFFTRDTG